MFRFKLLANSRKIKFYYNVSFFITYLCLKLTSSYLKHVRIMFKSLKILNILLGTKMLYVSLYIRKYYVTLNSNTGVLL